ncbi:MAG TPA: S9 family peptidase [Thermomicrobiaceae bacterium]|nr:S9 family peptidase [Thermomicrobiaceae bacterium]
MGATRYTPELAVGLRVPSEAHVSPDGRRVAFVVAPVGHEETRPTSAIWMAEVSGNAPARVFTGGRAEDKMPRWSPDGERLAFLSDRADRGTAQLFLIEAGGGEAQPLASVPRGLDLISWMPDGAALTATADRRALAGEQDPGTGIRVASQSARPRVIVRVPADGGEPSVIGPAEGHVWSYACSADGRRLAALTTPTDDLAETDGDVRLVLIDVKTRAERVLATLRGLPAVLQWSTDGARLVAVGELPGGRADDDRVFLIDASSGELTALEAGETTPLWATWLPGFAPRLLTLAQDGLVNRLDLVDLDAGSDRRLAVVPENGSLLPPLSLSADGRVLAVTRAEPGAPTEVWAGPLEGELRCLTHLNPELDAVELAAMEPVEWSGSDGLAIQGWLLRPPGATAGTPLPLVVQVHGGPTARWGAAFNGSWHDWGQVLAGAGYAVLLPNPRGSTGRGADFTAANRGDLGGMDFEDVMHGVDAMVERGVADPDRLAVAGWSYGGFMTAWTITHTDRFKAAVAGAAVTDWPSKVGTTDIRPMNEKRFPGALHEAPDAFWERSPVRYLGRITTPTLVVHGDADQRVPVSQGRELYLGLKAAGVPAEFVTYPRQKHAFHERACQLDLLERIVAWLGRWIPTDATS